MMNSSYPSTEFNRVLIIILAYNLAHIDPVMYTLNEYLTMCEAGWNVSVTILTANAWPKNLIDNVRERNYCYAIDESYSIKFEVHRFAGLSLSRYHRDIVSRELQNYDLFIYQEDDMLVRFNHIQAYLLESDHLFTQNASYSSVYSIGFMRYRRTLNSNGTAVDMNRGNSQECLDDVPLIGFACLDQTSYLQLRGNPIPIIICRCRCPITKI